jgi:hypothetical protein
MYQLWFSKPPAAVMQRPDGEHIPNVG